MGLISLEEAIRKATSLPASSIRIRDRGMLRKGVCADIVIFDPEAGAVPGHLSAAAPTL